MLPLRCCHPLQGPQSQEELPFHNAVLRPNPKIEEYLDTMLLSAMKEGAK